MHTQDGRTREQGPPLLVYALSTQALVSLTRELGSGRKALDSTQPVVRNLRSMEKP